MLKQLAVKGASALAGGAVLAITKNPSLAAGASSLVSEYAPDLIDIGLKKLSNVKIGFGQHKYSARDILRKIQENRESKVMDVNENRSEEGLEQLENIQSMGAGQAPIAGYAENNGGLVNFKSKLNPKDVKRARRAKRKKSYGKMAFHDTISRMSRGKRKYLAIN